MALNREFFVQDAMRGVFSLTLFNLYNRTNVWYKEFEVIEDEIIENDIRLMGRTVNAAITLEVLAGRHPAERGRHISATRHLSDAPGADPNPEYRAARLPARRMPRAVHPPAVGKR